MFTFGPRSIYNFGMYRSILFAFWLPLLWKFRVSSVHTQLISSCDHLCLRMSIITFVKLTALLYEHTYQYVPSAIQLQCFHFREYTFKLKYFLLQLHRVWINIIKKSNGTMYLIYITNINTQLPCILKLYHLNFQLCYKI